MLRTSAMVCCHILISFLVSVVLQSTDSNEPAFLRKLKSQYGGELARHERPAARPRKQKTEDDGDDDGPTYVDESNQDTISKEDYEKMLNPETVVDNPVVVEPNGLDESTASTTESASKKTTEAGIGASNKRRLAKIVGIEDETPSMVQEGPPRKVVKKKVKKIKLSFDEES